MLAQSVFSFYLKTFSLATPTTLGEAAQSARASISKARSVRLSLIKGADGQEAQRWSEFTSSLTERTTAVSVWRQDGPSKDTTGADVCSPAAPRGVSIPLMERAGITSGFQEKMRKKMKQNGGEIALRIRC